MFINTVIVLLRDLLPIFILFAYLRTLLPNKTSDALSGMAVGVMVGACVFLFAESISELAGGMGTEWLKIIFSFVGYLSFIVITFSLTTSYFDKMLRVVFISGPACMVSLNVSAFAVYFDSRMQQVESALIIVATIIGLGIAMSFSTIYMFFLDTLKRHKSDWLVVLLWSLFVAGVVSQSYSYLAQIDMISVGLKQLDLGNYIEESSEYGHLVRAVIGFELSPVLGQLVMYLLGTLVPMLMWCSKRQSHSSIKDS